MLGLHTMRFADEVVPPDDLELKTAERGPSEREVKMAGSLVEALAADFKPDKYEDSYRERVLEMIEAKAKGKQMVRARAGGAGRGVRPARRARGEREGGEALMPRPLWTGSLSFGLVNVPVQLVTAVRDQGFRFRQLNEKTHQPIEVKRFCSAEDVEVPYEEVAHGYELDEGKLVIITDEDLEAVEPRKTRTIEVDVVRAARRRSTPSTSTTRTCCCRSATARARCAPTSCSSRS